MQNKTIKELADELGVSKTAIRNKMQSIPEFREKYTKTSSNVISITLEGCEKIAESLQKVAQSDRKHFAESRANNVSDEFIEFLKQQIAEKDRLIADQQRQLEEQQKSIAELTGAVKAQAQSINADRHNDLAVTMLEEPKKKKHWWQKG